MATVELTRRAQRFLDKIDDKTARRIERRLKRLSIEPVPSDAKFIGRVSGEKVFRIRVGSHRVLYTIYDASRAVIIHKIDTRSRVYSQQSIATVKKWEISKHSRGSIEKHKRI